MNELTLGRFGIALLVISTVSFGCNSPAPLTSAAAPPPSQASNPPASSPGSPGEAGTAPTTTPASVPLPDLVVDSDAASESVAISEEDFATDDCALVEQCVKASGTRRLLRFDGGIINQGKADFFLGDPSTNPNFTFSPCHGHYHLKNMMAFDLIDPIIQQSIAHSTAILTGRKQGFCMEDMSQILTIGPDTSKYDCQNQGLSVGWEDIYIASLDCEYLDVTDVKPGKYQLRLTVNPDHKYPESDYSNNSAEVPVTIQ